MSKLFVVGIGPGGQEFMTKQAEDALAQAEIICGYGVYTALVAPLYPNTPIISTPMTQEADRCRMALEHAAAGTVVAMVCSGDAGVYGMASLLYELGIDYPTAEIVVVSGVTAALSGAAVLGAPLSHDFAVISLSDLLTSWDVIARRLAAAGMGDFCVAIYNPASKKRAQHLQRACDILLEYKSPDTVCGWVQNIGRTGQQSHICTLAALKNQQMDMFCTAFVGNEATKIIGGKMVTPRGYRQKAHP